MCPHSNEKNRANGAQLKTEGTNVPQRKGVGRERQLIANAITAKAEPGNTRPPQVDAPETAREEDTREFKPLKSN